MNTRWEVLSDQLVIWCCIDRLSWQGFSVSGFFGVVTFREKGLLGLANRLGPKSPSFEAHFNSCIFPAVIHRACRQTSSAGCISESPVPPISLYEGEVPVTSEMTEKSYEAVRCLYCSEPIPLSARLLEIFVVESDSATTELQGQSNVFTLRCGACSKESRYLKSEIEMIEGDPPKSGDMIRFSTTRYSRPFRKAAGQ
jgi:hypothetical protein